MPNPLFYTGGAFYYYANYPRFIPPEVLYFPSSISSAKGSSESLLKLPPIGFEALDYVGPPKLRPPSPPRLP